MLGIGFIVHMKSPTHLCTVARGSGSKRPWSAHCKIRHGQMSTEELMLLSRVLASGRITYSEPGEKTRRKCPSKDDGETVTTVCTSDHFSIGARERVIIEVVEMLTEVVGLSLCLWIYLSIYLSVVYPSIYLSVCGLFISIY